MTYAEEILHFYAKLEIPQNLPKGVEVLYPFAQPEVGEVMNTFYHRYYNDTTPRIFLIGINPKRFGAGVTGLPFRDLFA